MGTVVLILAGAVGAGCVLSQGIAHYRLRVRAWPNRLEDLCRPRPRSSGIRALTALAAATALAGAVAGAFTRPPTGATPWAAFLAGATLAWACLMTAHWSYSPTPAVAGMAMIVLCLTGLAVGLAAAFSGPASPDQMLAAGLIAVSVAGWLCMWLDRVWRQQRRELQDAASAFTTTGRMVGLASQFGTWTTVAASLVACLLVRHSLSMDGGATGWWPPTPTVPVLGTVALVVWLACIGLGPIAEGGGRHRLMAGVQVAVPVLAYAVRG